MARREVAQRIRDVAGVQPTGGHLVEQGLEGVVRVPVDEGDPETLLRQLGRRGQPSETRSDDNDMRHLSHRAI